MLLTGGLLGDPPPSAQTLKDFWEDLTLWMFEDKTFLMKDPSLGATGHNPASLALTFGYYPVT